MTDDYTPQHAAPARGRDWAGWTQAALVRAVRTAAQAAIATLAGLGIEANGIAGIDWATLGSITAGATLLSILMSLRAVPLAT